MYSWPGNVCVKREALENGARARDNYDNKDKKGMIVL